MRVDQMAGVAWYRYLQPDVVPPGFAAERIEPPAWNTIHYHSVRNSGNADSIAVSLCSWKILLSPSLVTSGMYSIPGISYWLWKRALYKSYRHLFFVYFLKRLWEEPSPLQQGRHPHGEYPLDPPLFFLSYLKRISRQPPEGLSHPGGYLSGGGEGNDCRSLKRGLKQFANDFYRTWKRFP